MLIRLEENEAEIALRQITELRFIKASVSWTKTDKVTSNNEKERPE